MSEAKPPIDRYQLRILSELYGLAHNLAGLNLVHPYGLILSGRIIRTTARCRRAVGFNIEIEAR